MNTNYNKFGPLLGVVHIGSSTCKFLVSVKISFMFFSLILTGHPPSIE